MHKVTTTPYTIRNVPRVVDRARQSLTRPASTSPEADRR